MPLPFLLGAAALVGGYGVKKSLDAKDDMRRANNNMEEANSIQRDAQDLIKRTENRVNDAKKSTEHTIAEFGKTKLSIQSGSLKRFEKAYSKMKTIVKRNNAKIPLSLGDGQLEKMKLSSQKSSEVISRGGGIQGIAAGTLTAIGAYGLTGAFATASTGAAISGLAGAAATNATLAWLGGSLAAGGLGMAGGAAVLGGLAFAPVLAISGWNAAKKAETALAESEKAIENAKENKSKAQLYEKQGDVECTRLYKISAFFSDTNNIFNNLDRIFLHVIYDMEQFDTMNIRNAPLASIKAAQGIAEIMSKLDTTPMFNKQGEISYEAQNLRSDARALLEKYN